MFLLSSRTRHLTVVAILFGMIAIALFGVASVSANRASIPTYDPRVAAETRSANVHAPIYHVKDATRLIPGEYIIVYKFNRGLTATDSERLVAQVGGKLLFAYENVFQGFAATRLTDDAIATLQANPDVAYLQQSQRISLIEEPGLGSQRLYLPLVQGRGGNSTPPTATPPTHRQPDQRHPRKHKTTQPGA